MLTLRHVMLIAECYVLCTHTKSIYLQRNAPEITVHFYFISTRQVVYNLELIKYVETMISRRKASFFLSSGTGQAGGLLTMSPSSPPLRAAHVNLRGLPNLSLLQGLAECGEQGRRLGQ